MVNRILETLFRAIIYKNIKSWNECLPFEEFTYNKQFTVLLIVFLFEVVYGFNSLTPLDLLLIHSNIFASEAATSKTNFIKILHKEVERNVKQNFKVSLRINEGRKEIIFQPSDWVWIHFRKERFSSQRKTKLLQRG